MKCSVVSEILGTNNYLVLSDDGLKHIVGVDENTTDDIDGNHQEAAAIEDDTVSVSSDLSEDFDDIYVPRFVGGTDNLNNVVNCYRRGQREVASLGPAPHPMSRLRSGQI